jgi:hypothetical protein
MRRPTNGVRRRIGLVLVLLVALVLSLAAPGAGDAPATDHQVAVHTDGVPQQDIAPTPHKDSTLALTRSSGGLVERQPVAAEQAVAAHNAVPRNPFAHLGRRLGHDDAPQDTRHTRASGTRAPPSR